ncbi:MAG: cytochrome b/b6 domain-containing protein [Eggerthellaceae bacterium]|nr:cytochrome b/b6 domain-containing protein [Eggerthellaceae bacterium]
MAHFAHYREAHPLPFIIFHYINLGAFLTLVISGIFIHFPYLPNVMGMARGAHITAGIVLIINLIIRIFLALFVDTATSPGTRQKEKEIKAWLPQLENRHQFIPWIKYYLFIKKDHPLTAKFNPLQKFAYMFLPFSFIFMAITGFAMWGPTMNWIVCETFTNLVGGLMNVRIIHYFMMFVNVIFLIIHLYMVITEGGIPLIKLMFLQREHGGYTYDTTTHSISGKDEKEYPKLLS